MIVLEVVEEVVVVVVVVLGVAVEEEEEEVVEKEMGVALCHNHNNHSSHNQCRQEVGGRTPRLLVHCIFPEVEVNIF